MNIFLDFKLSLLQILSAMAETDGLVFDESLADKVTAEPPKQAEMGDIASNVAMILAKPNQCKPQDLADRIIPHLQKLDTIKQAESKGGFINVRLQDETYHKVIDTILSEQKAFGKNDLGQGEKTNVEYVSVNPTGPLHIGHARGALVGDVLANLLEFCGYAVVREYYVNDGGAQVDWLARSAHWRYLEASGKNPEQVKAYEAHDDTYPGDYLIPVGQELYKTHGDKFVEAEESEWLGIFRSFAVEKMMDNIRSDLKALRITHDVFTSERKLIDDKKTDNVLEVLEKQGLLYEGVPEAPKGKQTEDWEPRPQTLFRSTNFGDDQDRAVKKSDGSWTYFANDMAYHLDKYQRGFTRLIDIFGADHAGYVSRMNSAVEALSGGAASFKILTCQLVRFMDDGEPVKMSKRAGQFVTMGDLVEQVGADSARLYMMMRKADAQLDFDFSKTVSTNRDNPVFYIQYAHARTYSLEKMFTEAFAGKDWREGDLSLLTLDAEKALMRKLAEFPRLLILSAQHLEPHRIGFYAHDLASHFHSLWSQGNNDESLRFIIADDFALTSSRIKLIMAMRYVLQIIADIIGFEALQEL